ncbi:hypothetical protein EV281_108104 [Rhizobium sp. BK418]|nr:hypothetical protein EV281_108104 [Rhizobium sp. BK418]
MIVTFGSINVDFVFSVADMPQPGQTLLAKMSPLQQTLYLQGPRRLI